MSSNCQKKTQPMSPESGNERKMEDEGAEQEMHLMSRRSFLWSIVAAAAGFTGWRWLITRPDDDGVPWPFRRVLEINEHLARDYYKPSRLSPTFPLSLAKMPRVNGDEGMSEGFDPAIWKLRVEGLAASDKPAFLTLDNIKALPRTEMVTELRCIEGWSEIVHWAGARFSDFMATYPPITRSGDPPDPKNHPENLVRYVSLETPDKGYYVGLEMESAIHPQTLLCYEMNGQPLTLDHGSPLRLVTAVKYGVKSIKRIGTIRFTDLRPQDFWAEQGYDWYAGH